MKTIKQFLTGFSELEIREALYYLGRFLKQAESFEEYSKDIFDDALNSEPSEKVKNHTRALIFKIEEKEGKQMKNLNDDEIIFWMDHIDEIESNLDTKISEDSINNAMKVLNDFGKSKVDNQSDDKNKST